MTDAIQKTSPITPMQLIQNAQQNGADIEKMQQLFELQLKWEQNEARKDYNDAISKFKSHNIEIYKTGVVDFTFNGKRTHYTHSKLDHIVDKVVPLLSEYGLSHSWETKQDNNLIHVKCRVSHVSGHYESVTLSAPPDKGAGKNSIQEICSTVTYLQRYTLMSILGLASKDDNDDNQVPSVECITESQLADIEALISEVGADESGFCGYLGVDTLETIPKAQYKRAVQALERKRK